MHARILLAAAALAFSAAAPAQGTHDGHAGHGAQSSAPSDAAADAMALGEVRRIDRAQGRITLRHGPLPKLGMGAMTMVFRAADASLLERVNEGDKVRFAAERIDGALTVVALEPAS
ncbi:copper-binding protein [Pseudorhodoferax sp.]|uniref:copper-binding protein n=1 Tax=Pseudorhodoferax sp. TaxID=1993553 RepID=UPI002DD6AA2C|nr:copper-binding protein [Pseudorhodoferax sp.]